MRTQELVTHVVQWMKAYAMEQQRNGFVIGVSGGVDSAVVSALAARTGLPTLCLFLPIHQTKAEAQRARAHMNALMREHAHVEGTTLDLSRNFDLLTRTLAQVHHTGDVEMSLVNLKSRMRLSVLYFYAGCHARLVVGTSNRTEHAVGFFAKFGDAGMDLNPLGELSKSEVYALAQELRVHTRIRTAPPTDGLWPDGRTDRDQLGAGYGELEWAMEVREGQRDTAAMDLTQRQLEVLRIYDKRHADNNHKLQEAPTCPIPFTLRVPPPKPTVH
jgi:NAD+ synthase